jgi:hypothetical protein
MLNIEPEQFDSRPARAVVGVQGVQGLLITDRDHQSPVRRAKCLLRAGLSLLTSHNKDGPFLSASRG